MGSRTQDNRSAYDISLLIGWKMIQTLYCKDNRNIRKMMMDFDDGGGNDDDGNGVDEVDEMKMATLVVVGLAAEAAAPKAAPQA